MKNNQTEFSLHSLLPLEKIAIQLGAKPKGQSDNSITDPLSDIAALLNKD